MIGRSTRESIATGVLRVARHGIAGLVREIAARIGGDVKVVVTGGHAIRYPMLAPEGAVIDAELLLKGAVEYARKAGAVKTRGAA